MTSKTSIKKELDALWYEIQHKIHRRCLICNEFGVEIHHLIPKSHILTAWDLENGVALTPRFHRTDRAMSAHGSPAVFRDYLKEYEPKIYEYLVENEHRTAHSLPLSWYQEKLEYLKEQLKCPTT